MFSPVRLPSWPPAGRNSNYPAVQILPASSVGKVKPKDDGELIGPVSLVIQTENSWVISPAEKYDLMDSTDRITISLSKEKVSAVIYQGRYSTSTPPIHAMPISSAIATPVAVH
jgi:hypothetical protein